MALSDTDLHWIPMNRSKFDSLRRMFDSKSEQPPLSKSPCDKCTSPRIRYTSAESVSALAQIRALLRPVEAHPDDSSTSSRSRSTSEDSIDLRTRNQSPALPLQNGIVLIDPLLCSKTFTQIQTDRNDNHSITITDETRKQRSVCETVAEVTENVTVSARDPVETTNSVVPNNIDHSNENGHLSPSPQNHITPVENGEPQNHLTLENGEVRNGHHLNGVVDSCVVPQENGVVKPEKVSENSNHTDELEKDKENNYLENGSSDSSSLDEEIHSNNIFLTLVNNEAEILAREREYFLSVLSQANAVSDEAGGRVMASCGKANLLLTSKFKQYRNLCYDYEKTSRKMTADDMQGFWDLILLQVEDIKRMFAALRKLQESNWIIPKSPMPKKKLGIDGHKTPSSTKKKPREKSAAQKARDEERRKMLAAKKLEMKQMMQRNGSVPEVIIT